MIICILKGTKCIPQILQRIAHTIQYKNNNNKNLYILYYMYLLKKRGICLKLVILPLFECFDDAVELFLNFKQRLHY